MIKYMILGTTVIKIKLNGLTEEYLSKLFLFESDSKIIYNKGLKIF